MRIGVMLLATAGRPAAHQRLRSTASRRRASPVRTTSLPTIKAQLPGSGTAWTVAAAMNGTPCGLPSAVVNRIVRISFGGPASQIAIMHQELVEKRRWISERRFLHALHY
jgi:hypothetical protein